MLKLHTFRAHHPNGTACRETCSMPNLSIHKAQCHCTRAHGRPCTAFVYIAALWQTSSASIVRFRAQSSESYDSLAAHSSRQSQDMLDTHFSGFARALFPLPHISVRVRMQPRMCVSGSLFSVFHTVNINSVCRTIVRIITHAQAQI